MSAPFAPSSYQRAIFAWAERGTGSAVVEAVAGSGKTTTLVQVAQRIPATRRCVFLAFNVHAAEALRKRLPGHSEALTFHALGNRVLNAFRPAGSPPLRIVKNKTAKILDGLLSPEQVSLYGSGVARLVALAKSVGIVPTEAAHLAPRGLVEDTDAAWADIVEHHDLYFGNAWSDQQKAIQRGVGITFARQALARSIEIADDVIDFDDMLYLAAVQGRACPTFEFVCVDEAQDTNAVQRALLRRICPPERSESRLLAVGDAAQAIYGWRGADHLALERIAEAWRCVRLPLSISYRCPRAVVRIAQQFVPAIEAAPDAEEGIVAHWERWSPRSLRPTDVILCRNNAPLVRLAHRLFSAGLGCRIIGRDFSKGIRSLIQRMRCGSVDDLLRKLREFKAREMAKAHARGDADQAGTIEDKVECIERLAEPLAGPERTMQMLLMVLDAMFREHNEGVGLLTLSTVHKAKGLEFDRVLILDRAERMPSKWAKQPWQIQQETNLIYVAATRAKRELVDIETAGFAEDAVVPAAAEEGAVVA